MESLEEYRRRAEDCRRLARLMVNTGDRRVMFLAAQRWRELAEQRSEAVADGDLSERDDQDTL